MTNLPQELRLFFSTSALSSLLSTDVCWHLLHAGCSFVFTSTHVQSS